MPSLFGQMWRLQDPPMPPQQQGGGIAGPLGMMLRGGGGDDEDLDAVRNYRPPAMPAQNDFPYRQPMPQRRQQSLLDLLPQILSGAGDVVNAGAGRNSNYLNQTMGIQHGMRDQEFMDALQARHDQSAYDQARRAEDWHRYGAEAQMGQQMLGHRLKLSELAMMARMMGDQKKKQEEQEMARQSIFGQQLDLDAKNLNTREDWDAYKSKKLMETQGDPRLLEMLDKMEKKKAPEFPASWWRLPEAWTGGGEKQGPPVERPGLWSSSGYNNPWLGGYSR